MVGEGVSRCTWVMALGVELISPVSFLLTRENVVETLQREPNGYIHAFPLNAMVILGPPVKLCATKRSP